MRRQIAIILFVIILAVCGGTIPAKLFNILMGVPTVDEARSRAWRNLV